MEINELVVIERHSSMSHAGAATAQVLVLPALIFAWGVAIAVLA